MRFALTRRGLPPGSDGSADPAVHRLDVAVVNVRDLGVRAEVLADLRKHPLLVGDAHLLVRLLRKVVVDVVIGSGKLTHPAP